RSGDVIQQISNRKTRTPGAWQEAVEALKGVDQNRPVGVVVARDAAPPMKYYWLEIRPAILRSILTDPGTSTTRAYPARAQGHFYHYIPYAGLLTELAVLTWGLLIASPMAKHRLLMAALAALYIALSLCLVATVTRSYLGAMLFASLLVVWIV